MKLHIITFIFMYQVWVCRGCHSLNLRLFQSHSQKIIKKSYFSHKKSFIYEISTFPNKPLTHILSIDNFNIVQKDLNIFCQN